MSEQSKKVLIVSYYWLPSSGTGTYRISKIVKYLKKLGWEPVILTPQKSASAFEEKEMDPDYKDIKVYYTKIAEPTFFFKNNANTAQNMTNASFFLSENLSWKKRLVRWIRVNLFIPDAKILWKRFAIRKGKQVIKKEKPEIILSTAPPPTSHLVARKLARWSNLKWIADFRDPWTNIFYYEALNINPISKKINKSLERKVLRDADRIITVSDSFFPDANPGNKNIRIENGYDPDDMPEIKKKKSPNKKFTIRYIGSLKTNQFFKNFLLVLKELSQDEQYRQKMKLETAGYIDTTIKSFIEKELQSIEVNIQGYIPHNEALKKMATADLLLLAIGKGKQSKNVVSTKIFEYMMVGNPILAFGHLDGSANKIIMETKAGRMFDYDAYDELKKYLTEKINKWGKGESLYHPDAEKIKKYNFENLTKKIVSVMEDII